MATFRNKLGIQTGFVPGVGEFADGILRNAPEDFENAAFEKIEEEQKTQETPQVPPSPAPAAPAPSVAPTPSVTAGTANVPVTTPITPQAEADLHIVPPIVEQPVNKETA